MKAQRKWLIIICLFLVSMVLSSCEKDKTITAPFGSTIAVYPDTYTFSDSDTSTTSTRYKDFTIIVLDANGDPASNIELYIDTPLVRDASQVMWFEEPYGTQVFNAVTVLTDENGGYQLRVGFISGTAIFSSDIEIISGSAEHATISMSVTN